jgi:uncharacterized membrane protein YbhN (UPF0104 family)
VIGFVSFAFNVNLGPLVGGIGLRYRLYTRFGLRLPVVTDVVAMSMLTNWLGYFVVAGAVFMFRPPPLPESWLVGSVALPAIGAALWCVVAAYLGLCNWSRRREWQLRGHRWTLPTAAMAGAQVVMASLNWLLIGGLVYTALQGRIDFPTVLGVLLLAAVAGLLTHVPAGLGVIEAVFVALLSDRLPSTELLGGLLLYRLIYYIAPLVLAAVLWVAVESFADRSRRA